MSRTLSEEEDRRAALYAGAEDEFPIVRSTLYDELRRACEALDVARETARRLALHDGFQARLKAVAS